MASAARIKPCCLDFETQRHLIKAIPDADVELRRKLLQQKLDTPLTALLDLCQSHYSAKEGAEQMCAKKSINAVRMGKGKPWGKNQTWDKKKKVDQGDCNKCTYAHLPGKCPAKHSKLPQDGPLESQVPSWTDGPKSTRAVTIGWQKPKGQTQSPCSQCE